MNIKDLEEFFEIEEENLRKQESYVSWLRAQINLEKIKEEVQS